MAPFWVVVVIALMGPVPVDSKLFGPLPDAKACEVARIDITAAVREQGLETFSQCIEVKPDAKPKPEPKEAPKGVPGTEQRS